VPFLATDLAPLAATFLAARSFLAIRAEMAAAASHDDAADRSFAAEARFSFAVIDAVMLLVIARQTVGTEEIGNGRAAQGDGLAENFLELGIKQLDLSRLQAGASFGGMNLGTPQAFVGVNVTDAADNGLIEKKRFATGVATVDQVDEGFASGFEGVGTEAKEFFLKARAGEEGHAAKTPGIDIAKFAAIVEEEDYMGVLGVRLGDGPGHEGAGHAEMNKQSGWLLRGGVSEAEEHEFSVAFDAFDGAGGKIEFDFRGIIDEVGFA